MDRWTQESLFSEPPRAARQPQVRETGRRQAGIGLPCLIDITALAEHLGVPVRHVRRLVAEDRIPYLKWGHLLRFGPGEIQTWLDQARIAPR
jgi:excisionase family DNA binding protein